MNKTVEKFNEIKEDRVQRTEPSRQMPATAAKIDPVSLRKAASEQRRQRVLEAARACFGEGGFAGATITAIAGRAGVSNGLLYQFFRSKEHLFGVVLREIIGDWVRALVPRDAHEQSASQALEGMFRRSVEFCRRHPLLPALLRGDQGLQLSRIREAGRDRVQPHRDLVASLLRRGVATGEFKRDLDVASVADIICQLQADYSARAYRRDPSYPDAPEIIDAAARFMRDAVRA
jgi:AcrR family transcriptional regulator